MRLKGRAKSKTSPILGALAPPFDGTKVHVCAAASNYCAGARPNKNMWNERLTLKRHVFFRDNRPCRPQSETEGGILITTIDCNDRSSNGRLLSKKLAEVDGTIWLQ